MNRSAVFVLIGAVLGQFSYYGIVALWDAIKEARRKRTWENKQDA